jgi:hypothetical protein
MENELVKMTTEERAEFEAFRAAKLKKEAEAKAKEDRETYKVLVEDSINEAFPRLQAMSEQLKAEKQEVLDLFKKAIEMKVGIFGIKSEQLSHTFSNIEGTRRITVGKYVTDGYADTVNEGISKVTEAIQGLGKDDNSKSLVKAVLRLLSKDSKGTLKASRVLQLRRMEDESGIPGFIEGVQIIEESYQPVASKLFIRCEARKEDGVWELVPLGMTEA